MKHYLSGKLIMHQFLRELDLYFNFAFNWKRAGFFYDTLILGELGLHYD